MPKTIENLHDQEYHFKVSNHIDNDILRLQLALANKIGQQFFDSTTLGLNELVGADYTFIGTLNRNKTKVKTLSLCDQTGLLEPIQYVLKDTPCEDVYNSGSCVFDGDVMQRYPFDALLMEMGIKSYAGICITDGSKVPIGIVVNLFKGQIENPSSVKTALELLSVRVQVEMERMYLDRQLKEQQERYELAIRAGNLGVYDFYVKKDIAVLNDRMLEIIGYQPGEANISLGWWVDHVHPEDRWQFDTYTKRTGSKAQNRVYRLRTKQEKYVWVESQSMVTDMDESGNLERIVGVLNDIHYKKESADQITQSLEKEKKLNEELKQREEALTINQAKLLSQMSLLRKLNKDLKESEMRWAYALEGNGDGVCEWNMLTNECYFSDRACEILGFKRGSFTHYNQFIDLIHPDSYDEYVRSISTAIKPPFESIQLEMQVRDSDNNYRWIMARGKVVEVNSLNQPQKMVGTVTDLSAHKIFQKEHTIYEEMIKQNQSAILFVSMNGYIEFANATTIELFGYKQHEIVGKEISMLFRAGDNKCADSEECIKNILSENFRGERTFRSKEGREVVVQFATTMLCQEGLEIGYVLNLIDVTEKRHLEEVVHKLTLAKLEHELETQRKQTELIIRVQEHEKETIARELHDGVGQLLSIAKLQLKHLESKLLPEKTDMASSILDLMQHITSDIRGITSDLMPLSMRNLGLDGAIKSLLERYNAIKKNEMTITSKIQLNGFMLEQSTAMHVYRIAQEAINNSIKYSNATLLSVMLMKLKNSVNLLIEDNGKGFELDKALMHPNSFGLKTMYERSNLIHGKLLINTSNEGTTISLTIPTTTFS